MQFFIAVFFFSCSCVNKKYIYSIQTTQFNIFYKYKRICFMFNVYVKELKHGFGIAHKTYIYGNTGTESPFTCKVEQFCLYNNVTTWRKNFLLDFSFVVFFFSSFFTFSSCCQNKHNKKSLYSQVYQKNNKSL